ncbi:MAG: DNA-3-methyladenine glycosylase [Bryobacterales bacterium]|nr:DNA-3-methyladenine glycosylase [Bryobacterales bacterium]
MTLPRSFYERRTVEVARDLLGMVLVHGPCSGVIVETEAYTNEGDLAAHSAAGLTPRTKVIFGPPGHAYVYLSYGVHECFNIVAEPDGVAGCVLIRALEPLTGIELMRQRRPAEKRDYRLASGPGNLTRVMGITRELYGRDMTRGDFVVETPGATEPFDVTVTTRIGITKTVDLPLRFLIRGHRSVSR